MEKQSVCIILLNFHGASDTIECLQSIKNVSHKNIQTVIVDNSEGNSNFNILHKYLEGEFDKEIPTSFPELISEDLSKTNFKNFKEDEIQKLNFLGKEDFILIKANKNAGFAAGNNIGIRYAQKGNFDFIWLLNNDTIITTESISKMIQYYDTSDKKLGIIGCKLLYYNEPDTIQALGGRLQQFFGFTNHIAEGLQNKSQLKNLEHPDYIVGASMFIPIRFINEVGLLDEDFFLYYEELNLAIRGKEKGYQIGICTNATVFHKEGKSIGSSYDANKRSEFSEIVNFTSRKLLYQKHFGLGIGFYFYSFLMFGNRIKRGQFALVKKMIQILFKNA